MAWDETDRTKYAVIRERYASDLSDEEFALIQPMLPSPKRGGRKPADPRSIQRLVLYDPLWLPLALSAEGLPTFHHRAEPLLRLA